MSGVVYFKFKSAISPDSVTFDGSFISVAELKNLIAARKGFGQDAGAELILTNPSSKEDYINDTQQIPRQTTVHVRRVPTSKPRTLQAAAAAPVVAPSMAAKPVSAAPVNGVSAAAVDEFGADLYSEQAAASTADEEEARIRALQQGTAASWSQQVMQGGRGGRGRGRGGRAGRMPFSGSGPPPPGYFCNKCGQAGHWRDNCPNEGEYKRVRAPAGIPMTRLMENKDGGLYAPDGTLVSLKPNEDAFLREMAGLPSGAEQASAQADEPNLAAPEASAAAAATNAVVPAALASDAVEEDTSKPLLLDNKPHSLGTEPQLAGESMFASSDLDFSLVPAAKPENAMTAFLPFQPQEGRSPTPEEDDRPVVELPRGPREFIAKAFERDEPLSQADFEDLQDAARSKYGYRPKLRVDEERPESRSRSRSREGSRHRRHHSRRRSSSLDRGRDHTDRGRDRSDRGTSRLDSSYERRSRRSSRPSRSPSRRRKAERRRSSSRHAASHKPSRSSSHRQPESKWTRSQERSTGGAASPAHSDDAYMPFDKGSDRWQPPDTHNTDEVLIRPEPGEEEAAQDQQASERAVNHSETIPASAVADDDDVVATSAAAVDDTEVQQDVVAPEETQKEQHRHRQRSSRREGERSGKRKRHHAEHFQAETSVHEAGITGPVSTARVAPVNDARVTLEVTDEVVSPSKRAKRVPIQVEPKPSGKLAGKTFTIPLEEAEEWQARPARQASPSPSKDTSDKKKKKHRKRKKHKKHRSKGKDKLKDQKGDGFHGGHDEDGESSDDTPDGRPDSSNVTRQLEHGASVDQIVRHNGSISSGHGNVTMQPDDSKGRGGSVHVSKATRVDADRLVTTMPKSDTAHASSQADSATGATGTSQTVKKSRALFGMAMGAVLRPGTLPGVKPKKK